MGFPSRAIGERGAPPARRCRSGSWGPAPALVLVAALLGPAGCGALALSNPVRMTLVNRTGDDVTGAWLRFDREIVSVDRLDEGTFAEVRLRVDPADTLRLGAGRLAPGKRVRYDLAGRGGAPRLVEGRWLVDGALGPPITDNDVTWR